MTRASRRAVFDHMWAWIFAWIAVAIIIGMMGRSITIWKYRAQKAEARVERLQNDIDWWMSRPPVRLPPPPPPFHDELSSRITELANKLRELEKANEPIRELKGPEADRAVQDADQKMGSVLEDL